MPVLITALIVVTVVFVVTGLFPSSEVGNKHSVIVDKVLLLPKGLWRLVVNLFRYTGESLKDRPVQDGEGNYFVDDGTWTLPASVANGNTSRAIDVFETDRGLNMKIVYDEESCLGYRLGDYDDATGEPVYFTIGPRLLNGELVFLVYDAVLIDE